MSILNELKEQIRRGNLFEIIRRDLRASDDREYRRWIYVSSAINQEISNRFNEPAFRKLSALFQAFIMGATIPIALIPDHKNAEWARLRPAGYEVWETRIRRTSPELRVLGRFADVDTFVALNLYDSQLKGRRTWDTAKVRCQSDWAALFPNSPPVHGNTANDYIRTKFTLI
jgi:hypothetical protein